MLGDRYGWMAPKDQCWAEVIDRQAWLEEHRGGVRLRMLEILHGVLNCPEIDGGCLLLLMRFSLEYKPKQVGVRLRDHRRAEFAECSQSTHPR